MKYFSLTIAILVSACGATVGPTYIQQHPTGIDAPVHNDAVLTPLIEVPRVGEATYTGAIGFSDGPVASISDARVVGGMSVRTDFRRNTMTGEADQFVDRLTGEVLSGDLVTDLRVYRDAEDVGSDAVAGFADGTLYRPNGAKVEAELDLFGDFYGHQGRRIAGSLDGEVSGLALTPEAEVSGVFDLRR